MSGKCAMAIKARREYEPIPFSCLSSCWYAHGVEGGRHPSMAAASWDSSLVMAVGAPKTSKPDVPPQLIQQTDPHQRCATTLVYGAIRNLGFPLPLRDLSETLLSPRLRLSLSSDRWPPCLVSILHDGHRVLFHQLTTPSRRDPEDSFSRSNTAIPAALQRRLIYGRIRVLIT
jgi:hypothetical protein